MKNNRLLMITSLLSILLLTFHMEEDILRDQGGMASYFYVTASVLAVWLYGTLVLPERRSGLIIMLVGSILGAGTATIHMTGPGSELAKTHGAFWVWLILAQGVIGVFSFILALRSLWSMRGTRPTQT